MGSIIGQHVFQFVPVEMRELVAESLERVIETGKPASYELDGVGLPGDERSVICRIGPIRRGGQIIELSLILTDITERKQAEFATKESEARFRAVFDESAIGMILADIHGRPVSANPAFLRMVGYSRDEMLEIVIGQIMNPVDRDIQIRMYREMLQGERDQFQCQVRFIRKDGSTVWTQATVSLIHDASRGSPLVIGMVEDVTERRSLQQQLAQSQKMEAIGMLAGGVAHDFNNLLTAMVGYAGLGSAEAGSDDTLRHYFDEISKASDRATNLTRQLLAFSRKQTIHPAVLNINELVMDMDSMFRRLIGENIELVTIPAPDLATVEIDPGQMEQVCTNLVVNARDAMRNGGKIFIETVNVQLDTDGASNLPGLQPGMYVKLVVTDTGPGIPEEVQEHIFEPFFTTKEVGKGTGLGLSVCYGIISQNKGHIGVSSDVGRGTSFEIHLPLAENAVAPAPLPSTSEDVPGGDETVLLVEDEPLVRQAANTMLELQGYKMLQAGNGIDAVRVVEQYVGGDIALLVTDVVMPLMGGRDLAERLTKRDPKLKVLFTSGYSDDAAFRQQVDTGSNFLQKPFKPAELARKVREILDQPASVK